MTNVKPVVLVVDDAPENIQILINTLQENFVILVANSGKKALEICHKEKQPDIILLDIMMPDMDGYEVCRRLKADERTHDIPIIFVTVLDEESDEEKGLSLGAVDYITKPVKPELVKVRVLNSLKLKQYSDSLVKALQEKEDIMIAQSRNAAMGEMIGMIAHQWRQPLNALRMVANNILLDVDLENLDKVHLKEYSHSIAAQTEYLSQTIDDFRNFFIPNKQKSEINVEHTLKSTMKLLGKGFENHRITVSVNSEAPVKIKTYPNELMQVFINLLKNAEDQLVASRDEDRRIAIDIFGDSALVVVTFCDNGGGIKEEIMKKIFKIYFSTKGEKEGSGLGLYISKMIIEKHLHGTIKASNAKEGACFTISLPVEFS